MPRETQKPAETKKPADVQVPADVQTPLQGIAIVGNPPAIDTTAALEVAAAELPVLVVDHTDDIETIIKMLEESEGKEASFALVVIRSLEDEILNYKQEIETLTRKHESVFNALLSEKSDLETRVKELETDLADKASELEEQKELLQESQDMFKELPPATIAASDDLIEIDGAKYQLLFPELNLGGKAINAAVLKEDEELAREILSYGTLLAKV